MILRALFFLALTALLASLPAAQNDPPKYERRWFYAAYNLQVDDNADKLIDLIGRAARGGYNGVVLADYKFNVLDRVIDKYFSNLARVRKSAAEAGVEIIPAVCSVGYSEGILAHDADLAEGLPVKDFPAVAKNGSIVPAAESKSLLRNGDMEQVQGDRFAGYSFQDGTGKNTFADPDVVHGGKYSCRMQDMASSDAGGNCRLSQRVKVRPYTCYRLSCWLKTDKLAPTGSFRLLALGTRGEPATLTHFGGDVQPTQDWQQVSIVFNSLHHDEINAYAGVWSGPSGRLWVDDFRLEELFLVNVLRRDGCPFAVKAEDGTPYQEGKDYEQVRDPKLGQVPYAGSYSFDHDGPAPRLTKTSRIREGDKLRVDWYHPVEVYGFQVMCCLSEPKVYTVVENQIRRVNELLRPRTYFLSHDEVRVANWCHACREEGKTPGELLAANVRQCIEIVKKVSPGAAVVVWSDMFDPYHNAVDNYYLVNGTLKGSWEGLPKDVIIANWHGGQAAKSLQWFADRGHRQVIAGYYDGDLKNFRRWDAAAKGVPGVEGFMYTTWQARYNDLEAYGKAMQRK